MSNCSPKLAMILLHTRVYSILTPILHTKGYYFDPKKKKFPNNSTSSAICRIQSSTAKKSAVSNSWCDELGKNVFLFLSPSFPFPPT